MLENVLNKYLVAPTPSCIVDQWINTLPEQDKEAFVQLRLSKVVVASLYKDLNEETDLPFKLTAFRSHLRGYCTCPK